jgi:hypothetical protein
MSHAATRERKHMNTRVPEGRYGDEPQSATIISHIYLHNITTDSTKSGQGDAVERMPEL